MTSPSVHQSSCCGQSFVLDELEAVDGVICVAEVASPVGTGEIIESSKMDPFEGVSTTQSERSVVILFDCGGAAVWVTTVRRVCG